MSNTRMTTTTYRIAMMIMSKRIHRGLPLPLTQMEIIKLMTKMVTLFFYGSRFRSRLLNGENLEIWDMVSLAVGLSYFNSLYSLSHIILLCIDGDLEDEGMERKVFINVDPSEGGNDPLWNHMLREENGMTLLCKHCDDKGFQKIYKLNAAGNSVARRHLKLIHKIHIDPSPSPRDLEDGRSMQTEGTYLIFL